MPDVNFYQKQYAYLTAKIDQALTALDSDFPQAAQAILYAALWKSEEAYIKASPEEP